MCCAHPRCWQLRSPAQGQCFLGPSPLSSQDSSAARWLEAPKQRSRSMGLAEQTGKRRAEHVKKIHTHTQTHTLAVISRRTSNQPREHCVCCTVPLWTAQQRSGLQSVWRWQVLPDSPLVAFWVHWPHTHSCSPQHSSSLVQDWKERRNSDSTSQTLNSCSNFTWSVRRLKIISSVNDSECEVFCLWQHREKFLSLYILYE